MSRIPDHEFLINLTNNKDRIPYDTGTINHVWMHMIPNIQKEIDILYEVVGYFKNEPEYVELFKTAAKSYEDIIAKFEEHYPKPIIQAIDDVIDFDPEWKTEWDKATFTQSLPLRPLTLISNKDDSGVLLYKDVDGTLYKVPNIWYNRPGNRKTIVGN